MGGFYLPRLSGLSVRGRPGSAGVAAAHAVHAASGSGARPAEIHVLDWCLGGPIPVLGEINCW